jgi:precorrin-3B synthase
MITTTMRDHATRSPAAALAPRLPRHAGCPGLFRIAPARDGGLCRLRIPLGRLSAAEARAVADAAARYGSGVVEVTNHANLQIRGVRPGDEGALAEALTSAGLGPAIPATDEIRNVMVSPAAGSDLGQVLDALPIALGVLGHLETAPECRALSPKFSVLVDGGEEIAAIDHPHDLWLAAITTDLMVLGIAGHPPTHGDDDADFLVVPASEAARAVAGAIAWFLDEAAEDSDVARVRDLLGRMTRAAVLDRLSEHLGLGRSRGEANGRWRRRPPLVRGHIGIRPQRLNGHVIVGAAPPLGRLAPQSLHRLAALAVTYGDGTLRLTPWQTVMLPNVARDDADDLVGALTDLGFACTPEHPLAATVACAGATGCASGRADAKADAAALARRLDGRGLRSSLHLSGCEKSCASAGVADWTLLATAPGTYDLFAKADGTAGRFGRLVARGLTVADAATHLRAADGR